MKINAIISEMFEEIKSRLVAIEKNLNGQDSRPKVIDEERRLKNNRTAIESVLKQISSYLSTIHSEVIEIPGEIKESQQKVCSKLEQVQATVTEQEKERTVRHHHIFDFKSSKVVLTFVILVFVILGATTGNVYQYKINLKMKDNDLKYRYIQMQGGINIKNLSTLEDIFQDHRNKKLINEIREEEARKKAKETERR
jgi:hypothetical protein